MRQPLRDFLKEMRARRPKPRKRRTQENPEVVTDIRKGDIIKIRAVFEDGTNDEWLYVFVTEVPKKDYDSDEFEVKGYWGIDLESAKERLYKDEDETGWAGEWEPGGPGTNGGYYEVEFLGNWEISPHDGKPTMTYGTMYIEVIVGNLGVVHIGSDRMLANSVYDEYVEKSKSGVGKSSGEPVYLWENAKIVKQYEP